MSDKEWISVKDRMPELKEDSESDPVLCIGFKRSQQDIFDHVILRWYEWPKLYAYTSKGKPIKLGWADMYWNTNPDGWEITHWQPLPQPPKV